MNKVIVGLVGIAGLAAAANAQSGHVIAQVWNGTSWGSTVDKTPSLGGTNAEVRVRFVVSYTGTAAPVAFAGGNFQPLVGRWTAGDAAALGATTGNYNAPAADDDFSTGEEFGRTKAFAFGNILASNALTAHQNSIGGVNTMRIAQATVTNAPGGGATLNNVNGSGGLPLTQNVTGPGRPADAPAINGNVASTIVYGFKITLAGNDADRNLVDPTKDLSIGATAFSTGGTFRWYDSLTALTGNISAASTDLAFDSAYINIVAVPSPASLALLGLGGLTVARRRR